MESACCQTTKLRPAAQTHTHTPRRTEIYDKAALNMWGTHNTHIDWEMRPLPCMAELTQEIQDLQLNVNMGPLTQRTANFKSRVG